MTDVHALSQHSFPSLLCKVVHPPKLAAYLLCTCLSAAYGGPLGLAWAAAMFSVCWLLWPVGRRRDSRRSLRRAASEPALADGLAPPPPRRVVSAPAGNAWDGDPELPVGICLPTEHPLRVRTKNYLTNGKRKEHAGDCVAKIEHVDFFAENEMQWHFAERSKCYVRTRADPRKFYFVLSLISTKRPYMHLVLYIGIPRDEMAEGAVGHGRLLRRFMLPVEGKEAKAAQLELRNERFKMIPRIVEGPWIVRTSVGNKPALLARKIDFRWFEGPNYLEADVDIASSKVASSLTALCQGFATQLRIDLAVLLEGRDSDELPERLLSIFSVDHPDLPNLPALPPDGCW